ncbi:FxsB family radical SAM/SPASM domain protein [Cryptosporangium phraense]|uniref:FxsB family radical SAM/SPASM domain protein n=2 Tax=Cryptosporangium phraense TaxID=2593070 RepID=A0A545AZE2_9ACTN|nr:FxsB family radical SAM/SPASM domain protein [Cryptosporangium phraense]
MSPAPRPTGEWPTDLLDVDGRLRTGWRPEPFTEFVVKVHSRCNLACDYCYMYEMADQSWRSQPVVMSERVMNQVCERIAEHAAAHDLPAVQVVLHGGEPLLAGPSAIRRFVRRAREVAGPTRVGFGVQTNGILLTPEFLDLFGEYDVRVGVSLDGDEAGQDRHRRYTNGRGSYDRVAAGLRLLTSDEYRPLFSGLLCTVDVDNDPIATYREMAGWAPPKLDYLLPHGNWETPPPRRTPDPSSTPYADWLIPIFDHWYDAPRPAPRVRMFGAIMRTLLGRAVATEHVGLAPIRLLVIETDGTLQQVDTLKSTYAGAPETGLNVAGNALDDALLHPSIVARQIGVDALGPTCRACSLRDVCGGGDYPHRYRPNSGFRHPSVYCPDLMRLITHVKNRLESDLLAARKESRS